MSDRADLADSILGYAFHGPQTSDPDHYERAVRGLIDLYWSEVPANLFTESGKWKYEVRLDYRNPPEGYISCNDNARRALRQATENGTSEVTISVVPEGWSLVVLAPPEGYPVMARGGAA